MNKIHTYSLQDAPFIHIDGDVFLWEKFADELLNSHLIAQNIEGTDKFYRVILDELASLGIRIPGDISNISELNSLKSCNAGIFGGSDIPFFKEYTQLATTFTSLNYEKLLLIENRDINMVFEQLFFYYLAKKKNKEIKCLFSNEVTDMSYLGMVNFIDVPHLSKFIHMMGSYKINEGACKMLAKRLRLDFPDYYYKVIGHLKKNDIKMYLGAYNVGKSSSENLGITKSRWKKIYKTQLAQQHLFDTIFVDRMIFLNTKFITNEFVLSHNDLSPDLGVINVPCSLEEAIKQREVDELDKLLMQLLETVKSTKSVLEDLSEYWDPQDYKDNKTMLFELVTIKLRSGCEDNIFHIIPEIATIKVS